MKKLMSLIFAAVFVAAAGPAGAATSDFPLSVTMPTASGVQIVSNMVDSSGWHLLTAGATIPMAFNTMVYDPTNGYWAPTNYFAIDCSMTGGSGAMHVDVKYSEGTPGGAVHGLGYKGIMTFKQVTTANPLGTSITNITGLGGYSTVALKDLTTQRTVSSTTSFPTGWLRMYIGIETGDPIGTAMGNATGGLTASEMFTNASTPGSYTGTVTVTALTP